MGLCGVLAVTAFLAAKGAPGQSTLSPVLRAENPGWLAGPLRGLLSAPSPEAAATLQNAGLPAMFLFYLMAVLGSARLGRRFVFGVIAIAMTIAIAAPPGNFSDELTYLDLSRIWVQFHVNPYASVINSAPHVGFLFQRSVWHNIADTYGSLFTLLITPFSLLPLALAYWATRIITLAAALGTVWLCALCAREVRGSQSGAMILFGLNPLTLYYCVVGGHNDIFALAPLLGALLLVLRARSSVTVTTERLPDRWCHPDLLCFVAGVLAVAAIGMKATAAIFLVPLVLVARRRSAALLGIVVAGIGMWVLIGVFFGGYLPNVVQQSQEVNTQALGSVIGYALGLGGDTVALQDGFKALLVAAIIGVALAAWRRPQSVPGCFTCAGIALVCGLSWVMPWYGIWFLAPGAICRSKALKLVCVGLSALMLLSQLPDNQWLVGSSALPLNELHVQFVAKWLP
jgi:hypothetical protein